jgi:Cu(I)/Ag(I) efflux system membrane protein CusA/SilA
MVAILMLVVAILMMLLAMYFLHLSSNIMSLGGIAIAIGAMVDGAIGMIGNAHKHLEAWEREGRKGSRDLVIIEAAKEVGKPFFFSLLIIAGSFIPVFTLAGQEGRLFRPLAFTKAFSMAFAAILSATLVPVLMLLFMKGKIATEGINPVNRFLVWVYEPVVHWRCAFPKSFCCWPEPRLA